MAKALSAGLEAVRLSNSDFPATWEAVALNKTFQLTG
jgi:hypothetical protein